MKLPRSEDGGRKRAGDSELSSILHFCHFVNIFSVLFR